MQIERAQRKWTAVDSVRRLHRVDRGERSVPGFAGQLSGGSAGRERLAVSEQTLRHRLHARGLLASIDASRHVLHLKAG